MSETSRTSSSLFLSLSAGLGGTGPAGLANLTFGRGAFLLSARASLTAELELLGRPEVELVEYSLMAGYGLRDGSVLLHAMAGAGYATVTRNKEKDSSSWMNGDYETSHDHAANLPLQVGVAWDARYLGIGLTAIANINHLHSDCAFLLTLALGKMR